MNENGTISKVNGLRTLVLLLMLVFVSPVTFAQSADTAKIIELEKELAEHFTAGRFKEALPVAKQLVTLNEAVSGSSGDSVESAYTNLGMVERALERYSEASVSFLKALEVQKNITPARPIASQIVLLGLLADCQNADKKYTDAAVTYNTVIGFLEKSGIQESADAFEILLRAANNLAQAKEFVAANELYKKTLKVSEIHFKGFNEQKERLLVYRTCYFSRFQKDESLDKDYTAYGKEVLKLTDGEGEMLNGKATSLPRPVYPGEAVSRRLSGKVFVKIHIDIDGNVKKADVICSDPLLGGAAIKSAYRAKFAPTQFNGQPVEVFGLITYNFVAP